MKKKSPDSSSPSGSRPRATSLKQIAEVAGVHVTTVSLALRNSPQLPAHTRERLQKLAAEMGYRANPMVVALMQQRRTGAQPDFQGTLGFITRSPDSNAIVDNGYVALIYKTASIHAADLGYKLDHFEIFDYGNDPRRLEKALHARNIRGLFFPPPERPDGKIIDLNWEHFAPITMSTSIVKPAMDRVDGDHHGGARLAFKTCLERGYTRPGYISLASSDYRTQGRWRAGFLSSVQETRKCRRLPVLVAEDRNLPDAFAKWYDRWRPDVLLANSLALTACVPVLRAKGVSIPDETALVDLNIHDATNPYSGIYTGVEVSCHRVIDYLVSRLQRNVLGLPKYPHTSVTAPAWKEGNSLPDKAGRR